MECPEIVVCGAKDFTARKEKAATDDIVRYTDPPINV